MIVLIYHFSIRDYFG